MTIFNRFARMNPFIVALCMAVVIPMMSVPAMGQQTLDPSGACTPNSTSVTIDAQSGEFVCAHTAGAATGTWRRKAQTEMKVAYAKYDFAVDGGAISTITLATNQVIPANAIILGVIANPTTALVGATATIAIGTVAGSSTTALKGATAVASYSIDALLPGTPVFTAATAVKMSAAGAVTITVATAALTAGVMDIFVFYVVSSAA